MDARWVVGCSWWLLVSVAVAGCGGEDVRPVDAGPDLGQPCVTSTECDDGVFCKGAESCTPGGTGADERGCVHDGNPCVGATCDEATDECVVTCGDGDGDGFRPVACGGDDCDDGDSNRFPGNIEDCDDEGHDEDCNPATVGLRDADDDGFIDAACCNGTGTADEQCGVDCDDADPGAHPTEAESCDGTDNDCDGTIDESARITFFRDIDGDMYGQESMTRMSCSLPSGYGFVAGDCNDSAPAVHPSATETCNAVDDDCDGSTDPGCPCTIGESRSCGPTDGSGMPLTMGVCRQGTQDCAGSAWGDCEGAAYAAAEACNLADDDCDGQTDEGVTNNYYRDVDGDQHGDPAMPQAACAAPLGYAILSDDCDDSLASVRPGAGESCNMVDDDCDGGTDEGVQTTYYGDSDSDDYGQSVTQMLACSPPSGYVSMAGDCNDMNPLVFPLASESCANMIDDNCSGTVNEGCACTAGQMQTCGTPDPMMPMQFLTTGACQTGMQTCSAGGQWQMCSGNVGPIAETCNSIDDDCDDAIDEGARVPCHFDADDDGYAPSSSATSTLQCRSESRASVGYCPSMYTNRAPDTAVNIDCNDMDTAYRPGATEECSVPALDQNCNGNADEGYVRCYVDADNDGYALVGAASLTPACPINGGYGGCGTNYTSRNPAVAGNVDCDAADPLQYPGATEVCNSSFEDDDCDGTVDDGFLEMRPYYTDYDNDNYTVGGVVQVSVSSCRPALYVPSGYRYTASPSVDCCDRNSSANPGAASYYSSPLPASCGGGYDYDCSGAITHRPSVIGLACEGTINPVNCCVPSGTTYTNFGDAECYSGSPPACGASVFECTGCSGTCGTCTTRNASASASTQPHACR